MAKIIWHPIECNNKGTVFAGLGGKGLRKKDCQIGPVNPFLPGARLSVNNPNRLSVDKVLNNKGTVLAGMGGKGLNFNCKSNNIYVSRHLCTGLSGGRVGGDKGGNRMALCPGGANTVHVHVCLWRYTVYYYNLLHNYYYGCMIGTCKFGGDPLQNMSLITFWLLICSWHCMHLALACGWCLFIQLIVPYLIYVHIYCTDNHITLYECTSQAVTINLLLYICIYMYALTLTRVYQFYLSAQALVVRPWHKVRGIKSWKPKQNAWMFSKIKQ